MKNLLNNISSDEKQRILEQHSGGKLIDTRNFRRLLESKLGNVKPLIVEQEVKQGTGGDPFQYKKEGGKYFYAKKAEGTNAKWVEQTKPDGIKAIQTKIFGETPGANQPANTNQPQTTNNQPANTAQPANTTQPSTTQPSTNQPANTTNQSANQQSSIQWEGVPVKGGTFGAEKCNTSNNMINNQAVKGFLSDGGSTFYSRSTIDQKQKTYYFGYQEPIRANSSYGKKYCKITNVVTYNLKGYTNLNDNQVTNNDYSVYLVTSEEIAKPVE